MYSIKEMFYTLQGEGAQSGRPAVFCRFTGCNLWSGREQDREQAICKFCDTDFVGTDGINGGTFETAVALAEQCRRLWPANRGKPLIVLTGGEPMLQVDDDLIRALHDCGFEIAIETNGTLEVPRSIDWICVSPKAGADLVQTSGDELKLIFPQSGLDPESFIDLSFGNFYLQPKDELPLGDPAMTNANITAATAYCMEHPTWSLSLQTHKILGIS